MSTKALNISKELGYKGNIARSNRYLSTIHLQKNELNEATTKVSRAIEIYTEIDNPEHLSLCLELLARIQLEQGQTDKAYKTVVLALEKVKISNSIETEIVIEKTKAQILQKKGDYSTANQSLKKVMELSDSLSTRTQNQQLEELKIIYETEKYEQNLALQAVEIDNLEKTNLIQKSKNFLLIGGLIIVSLIAVLLYYLFHLRIKKNLLLKENLNKEIGFKNRELSNFMMQLAHKNSVLEELKTELEKSNSDTVKNSLINKINVNIKEEKNWKQFNKEFAQLNEEFVHRLKSRFDGITPNELRLIALIKMNLRNNEIASLLNISADGIKKARFRLRKKMNLETSDSLEETILSI